MRKLHNQSINAKAKEVASKHGHRGEAGDWYWEEGVTHSWARMGPRGGRLARKGNGEHGMAAIGSK